MEQDKIRALLRKFKNAESSLEEEEMLAQYFNTADEIPEDIIPFKTYFQWTQDLKEMSTPRQLKQSIQNITEKHTNSKHTARFIRIREWTKWAAAAAAILLVVFIWQNETGTGEFDKTDKLVYQETFDDPEKAYEQTMLALAFLSNKLNNGQTKAASSVQKLKELDHAIPQ